jgi:hypothetical protein
MKAENQIKIMDWLKEQGIASCLSGSLVAVNRDSMCRSRFRAPGIPEEGTYPKVLAAINAQFPHPRRYYWFGKSDEDLFLDTMGVN